MDRGWAGRPCPRSRNGHESSKQEEDQRRNRQCWEQISLALEGGRELFLVSGGPVVGGEKWSIEQYLLQISIIETGSTSIRGAGNVVLSAGIFWWQAHPQGPSCWWCWLESEICLVPASETASRCAWLVESWSQHASAAWKDTKSKRLNMAISERIKD